MKKYLYSTLALLCLTLHASDNPFDLEKNLNSLENEDDLLFAHMKETKKKVIQKAPPLEFAPKKEEIIPSAKIIEKKIIKAIEAPISHKEKALLEVFDKEQAEVDAYEKKRAEKLKVEKSNPKIQKIVPPKEKKSEVKKEVVKKKRLKKKLSKSLLLRKKL